MSQQYQHVVAGGGSGGSAGASGSSVVPVTALPSLERTIAPTAAWLKPISMAFCSNMLNVSGCT